MAKVELVKNPKICFDYVTSDEISGLDAHLVSDEVNEVHYESNDNFIMANSKTNVVIAAFTTAYARLKLYGVLEDLGDTGAAEQR